MQLQGKMNMQEFDNLHLAVWLKCNLGKDNLETMLSGSLWMQETLLWPWRFAGTLCDTNTQWPALAGHMKLWVAQALHRCL